MVVLFFLYTTLVEKNHVTNSCGKDYKGIALCLGTNEEELINIYW